MQIIGADTFPISHTPVAEVVIVSRSKRNLTVFTPTISPFKGTSYNYNGYIQDNFGISFSISFDKQCQVLAPGQKLSIAALFPVTGVGRHKIIVSGGFPVYKKKSFFNLSTGVQGLVVANYIFTIK